LSEIAHAVRNSFRPTAAGERQPNELPSFGRGGLQPGVDLNDGAPLLDLMESDG
jgi:hypothetical protein